ncbi:HAD-IIIA family hydrolase [Streptomyces sp. NPDC047028]|uniref:HAD-IIIA family hydrolase n=1 Tax=Streptomyces sp. NPDC047028 TaxID=3155793 RepID=UPI0033D8F063
MSTGHPRELPLAAVLFDREGTLVHYVPYNGDPLATGVVSNQSGVGRGLLTEDEVRRVNERANALLGGLDTWLHCPHLPDAACPCRKPRPGLVLAAAARLGVSPHACLVIGDIAADVEAAHAAGARAALVPNAATAPAETKRYAAEHAPDALTALRRALARTPAPAGTQAPRTPPNRPEARPSTHTPATVPTPDARATGHTSDAPASRHPAAPASPRAQDGTRPNSVPRPKGETRRAVGRWSP